MVDLIARNPVFVPHDATVATALVRAREAGVHHLVVLREAEVIGVCCLCDLSTATTTDPVSAVMSSPAVVIDDQGTAGAAAEMMRVYGVGCIPVVDWASHVKGVVTRSDLVRAGLIDASEVRGCSSCGNTHGVIAGDAQQPLFCRNCLDQSRPPHEAGDDLYFTLGGGD